MSVFYDTALEPCGIKTTQFAILSTVNRAGPLTVGALARQLVMDAGGLAHTLKPLVREGMLSLEVDPSDKRNRLVSIQPLGIAKLAAAKPFFEAAQNAFESAFGRSEAQAMREAVKIVASDQFLHELHKATANLPE